MSKYEPLKKYFENIPSSISEKTLGFGEIVRMLGSKLPSSAYDHRAWWSNPKSPADHPYAQSWLSAGWRVDTVNQGAKWILFRRIHSHALEKKVPHTSQALTTSSIQNDSVKVPFSSNLSGENKQFLLDLGFEEIGEWIIEAGTLQFILRHYQNNSNILYAFIAQSEIKYIGKSTQTLLGRMNGYKNPGPTQSTNIKNNSRIKELLIKGTPVQILVLVQKEEMLYRGMPIILAAGLEDNLIARLRPPWNERG
jgi:hypothetical protein